MKICTRCKIEKTKTWFSRDSRQKDGLQIYCKECVSLFYKEYYDRNPEKVLALKAAWKKNNPEKRKAHQIKSYLKILYGTSPEEYDKMFEKQNKGCAICGKNNGYKRLAVDHDHKTNKIRELLCNAHNTGLENFGDSIELLQKAILYLEKHKERPSSEVTNVI